MWTNVSEGLHHNSHGDNYTNLHKEQAETKTSDQFLSALQHVLMAKSVLLDLGFDQLRNHSYVSPEENFYIGIKMDILVPGRLGRR